jgi:hypothetical protein
MGNLPIFLSNERAMNANDSGANAEAAYQTRIMELRSEISAIRAQMQLRQEEHNKLVDKLAALGLELKSELHKSGLSSDSGYLSSASFVGSIGSLKRRRVSDSDEHHPESILEEEEAG